MTKKLLCLVSGCMLVLSARAGTPGNRIDSIPFAVATKYSSTSLIIPMSALALGSIGTASDFGKRVNRAAHQTLGYRTRPIHIDDYLQYLPVASLFVLSLTNAQPIHQFTDRFVVAATSYAVMGLLVNGIKYSTKVQRPRNGSRNSFPSGHTATAFMGAELLRLEYGTWYGVGGYTVAAAIGVARLYNQRHWLMDVLGGAGVGILSAQAGYYLNAYIKQFYTGSSRERRRRQTNSLLQAY